MAESNLKKNAKGHNYKYTDLAQIHEYLEEQGYRYYQYVERIESEDYIYTVPIIDGQEKPPRRGCRVEQATLRGVNNPAQEQGSALTYARRYSLLMAFGLATTDDDAQIMSTPKTLSDDLRRALDETSSKNSREPRMSRQELEDKFIALCDIKHKKVLDFCKQIGVSELAEATEKQLMQGISFMEKQ